MLRRYLDGNDWHRPPTRVPRGRWSLRDTGMDMRHPSTPGDRETVRAGPWVGQIPYERARMGARRSGPQPVDRVLLLAFRRGYVQTSSRLPAIVEALDPGGIPVPVPFLEKWP
jgi:hypothetical protein